MRPKALITGVTGQDGWYLSQELLAHDYEVWGLVRRSSQRRQIPNGVIIIEGDVTDNFYVPAKMDHVYHLAAQSDVGLSFKIPKETMRVNHTGTLSVLSLAQSMDARFYHASSSEIFGNSPSPQAEDSALDPQSPYACSKVAAHVAVQTERERGYFAVNGICFNHESPRRGEAFVTQKVATLAAKISKGEDVTLKLGSLRPKRDWGYSPDYVRAMRMMLEADEPADYVIATGISRSVGELVDLAAERIGKPIPVEIDPSLVRPKEVWDLKGDPAKIRQALGWRPSMSFETMIDAMIVAAQVKLK